MKIHFFGGANEIGASSMLIEIDGYRILVDAGIRMGVNQESQSPDFPDFDKVGMPDAVLLTHAHTDHTGALPVLGRMLPADVKIYCTPPTKEITKVLLEDSARRMEREKQKDDLSYTSDDVAAVLNRMATDVSWSDPVEICPSVKATWIPAGHILGAAMIYITGKSESILMTGDVSVSKQLTIPSVDVPTWCKPDVMVMESTYGNRPHKTRTEEEKSLVNDVANTIKEGGTVLLPAFAVGRSQEVILILNQAMERKEIPEFPVYVDGMVRDINRIYSEFAAELRRPLRRKAEQGEPLFYSGMIEEVQRNTKPESILAKGPCCVVASSGMLVGGKSIVYAKHLARDEKNLIAITGYQAEGTPGRSLEGLRKQDDPENRMWSIDDETDVHVKCRIERYSLSAHADKDELIDLVRKVQPRKLFLVHGDAETRGELFKSVRKACPAVDVKLPENGQAYTVRKRIGIAGGRKLSGDRILREVAAFVQKMERQRPFRVRELAEIWFGTEAITPIAVKFFEWCLSLESQFFECRSDNLFYLRQII